MDSETTVDRFKASTNRTYGVVDDEISEDEIYRHDENPVMISQFREDGEYWLHIGSRVGLDTTIMFHAVDWEPGEYSGTLWFRYEMNGELVTVGNLSHWHPATPQRRLGLVGEWLAERVDLSEYESGVECPECGSEVYHIRMHSTCEDYDCDFYCEGHYDPNYEPME